MKILVVGGGGREHAIIRKLRENPEAETIYCAPGNGGIAADAECVPIKATDLDGMVAFAKEHAVDLAVVAPDDPLALGMVDAMNAAGVRTFGPNKAAARIEGSKVFAKNLMEKYGIPTAKYRTFDSASEAVAYIETQNAFPTVVKADGLALGKGVVIAGPRRGEGRGPLDHGGQALRRVGQPHRRRGIFDRARGERALLLRRGNGGAHDLVDGS